MKFITPDKLLKQLQNHLQGSSSVNVAVAWISDSPALEAFLYAAGKLKIKVQIVTGVGGYLTHPDTLERVASVVQLKIYGNAGGPLFHPKLYVFKRDFRSTAWIGSANLTGSAFSINAETVVEIDDSLDVALQEFLRFWNSSLAIPFSSFDTAKYRLEREALFRDSADKSASSLMPADALMDPTPESDPLRAGWQKYLAELRAVRGGDPLDAWLKVLDEGKTFVSRDWSEELSEHDLAVMYGKQEYAPFGQLPPIKQNAFQGASNRKNRGMMGKALGDARSMKRFDPVSVVKVFENLCNIPSCGVALATRLLILTRPDIFVVVNRKSFAGLAKKFDMWVTEDITAQQYAKLLQVIQEQPWYKSGAPKDSDELRIWNGRAALIDPLVYSEA